MPRMKILNTIEQETFDTPPLFNSVQRKKFFDFPFEIRRYAETLRTPINKVFFFITCGYFKAAKRFFTIKSYHSKDIKYIAHILDIAIDETTTNFYFRQSIHRNQFIILKIYGYREFDENSQEFIIKEIETMARSQLKPKLIFWRCIDLLLQEKIQIPRYFKLSELILTGINKRKKELIKIIKYALPKDIKSSLDNLLTYNTPDDTEKTISTKGVTYKLTLLKKLSQSTKPSKVKEKVNDLVMLQKLFTSLYPILKKLELNYEGIRYYATSVIKSEIFQVTRRSEKDRYLHIIAFIAYQYYRLQDNLIDVLLTSVQNYQNTAKKEHKDLCYSIREQRINATKEMFKYFSEQSKVLSEIFKILINDKLNDITKIENIRKFLERYEHDQIETKIISTKKDLENDFGNNYYQVLEKKSMRIQNRVSPIIKTIEFQGEINTKKILEAIQYFKKKNGIIDSKAPIGFLKQTEQKLIKEEGTRFRISLYKALLFIHIQDSIKSGSINLTHSYKYRPLDDYLISRENWRNNKDILLKRSAMENYIDPNRVLKDLDKTLLNQYATTNDNIQNGKNKYIKIDKNGLFRLKTPKSDEDNTEQLHYFFPERRYVSLLEVLSTVNRYSSFLNELHHWQQRYNRTKPSQKTFFAGIVGLGCGIGTRKMARISQRINEKELDYAVNWYFSPEGINAANDCVLQLMDRLELPNVYRSSTEKLHTSSDGQKFEVQGDSLNTNYSFKYFGKGQGVSVYSFIDERNLLWYSVVISAAERESAYVIDGLMHNDVVKSDIHSTDSHGYSEAIFGATHLLGFSYAPRIKNLKKQRLYIFKENENIDKSNWKIYPFGYIDTQLIKDNWDDILRLIVSIKLKQSTASEIFRRLNSYSKQHPLYKALKEFGKIIKSIFILRYIDDVELRQAIEKQLNKIEHAHSFTRAISVGNPQEFIQTEKRDQDIAEGCKRLIKNTVTCWNYIYLTQKLVNYRDTKEKNTLLQSIINGSVISWQHINLLGEYDFSDEKLEDSVGIKPPKLIEVKR